MSKRIFDVMFALLAVTLLAPLFFAVALAIWLEGRGPVLFRQVRVGRHGREFGIYKFRTMAPAASVGGPEITVAGDPRITRVGAILRRYKIDEFPQFINVLLGHMSVVGPRPEVPRYVALYPPHVREVVLSVQPGVTDLASIEYRNENELLARSADPEATYRMQILPAKLMYYARYARERSFFGDLVIIARSFAAVFVR